MINFSIVSLLISFAAVGCASKTDSQRLKGQFSADGLEMSPPGEPSPDSVPVEDFSMTQIPEKIYHVNTEALNVRSGPGMTFSVVTILKKGSKVAVLSREGNWAQIEARKWVYSRFLALAH